MNKIILKDYIKRNIVKHNINDIVYLYKRKGNGYPKSMKYDTPYRINKIENDFVYLDLENDGKVYDLIKVHKTYVISKNSMRDIQINRLLKT